MSAKIYLYNGKEYTLPQAAKEFGINEKTLYHRINYKCIAFDVAIKIPPKKGKRKKIYFYNDKKYTLDQAAKEFDLNKDTIRQRMNKGKTFKEAVEIPLEKHNKIYFYNGKKYTLYQAEREFGIKYVTLLSRIRKGMTLEEAIKTQLKVNKIYIYKNKEYTLPKAAKEFGVHCETLRYRINKIGMTFEEAVLFNNPKFIDSEKKNEKS